MNRYRARAANVVLLGTRMLREFYQLKKTELEREAVKRLLD
jgi:hypothetical protein